MKPDKHLQCLHVWIGTTAFSVKPFAFYNSHFAKWLRREQKGPLWHSRLMGHYLWQWGVETYLWLTPIIHMHGASSYSLPATPHPTPCSTLSRLMPITVTNVISAINYFFSIFQYSADLVFTTLGLRKWKSGEKCLGAFVVHLGFPDIHQSVRSFWLPGGSANMIYMILSALTGGWVGKGPF